jgi:serine/threonine-protein kinase RsbW
MATEKFPGRFESLAGIRKFVFQAASEAGFDEDEIYAVELAVDEACSNIIDIECTCNNINGGLEIILKDKGKPFDPEIIPAPDFSVDLDHLKPRGAGLFLIRNMMDDVEFNFSENNGNVIRMVKRKAK